jgi:hypothetical protein
MTIQKLIKDQDLNKTSQNSMGHPRTGQILMVNLTLDLIKMVNQIIGKIQMAHHLRTDKTSMAHLKISPMKMDLFKIGQSPMAPL